MNWLMTLTPHVEGQDVEYIPMVKDTFKEALDILKCYKVLSATKDYFKFRLYMCMTELN